MGGNHDSGINRGCIRIWDSGRCYLPRDDCSRSSCAAGAANERVKPVCQQRSFGKLARRDDEDVHECHCSVPLFYSKVLKFVLLFRAQVESGKGDKTYFPDPKVLAGNHAAGVVASGLEDKSGSSHVSMHAEQAEASSSNLKGHMSTFAALSPPRIALRIVAAENLPIIPDISPLLSRPFVTLTV